MKLDALAYASINQLSLISLHLEPCCVPADHRYRMLPSSAERFVYIKRGKVCFSLEKGKLYANGRDMVYLPGNTAYHSLWLQDSEFIVVDILLHDVQGQAIRFEDAPSVLFHDVHHIYDGLLSNIAAKAESCEPFDWLERMSLSFTFLCQIARDTNRVELDAKNRRIQAGLAYLESNYTKDFSMEHLSKMCAISPAGFRRSFVACKGMSPVEYRNRLRIRKASELLRSGKYTVGEAAELVGIQDIKYFSKLFKRYTGLNPSYIKQSGI